MSMPKSSPDNSVVASVFFPKGTGLRAMYEYIDDHWLSPNQVLIHTELVDERYKVTGISHITVYEKCILCNTVPVYYDGWNCMCEGEIGG